MAIHIQNDETEWLVHDFTRRRGIGITEANILQENLWM
jgi:hypothetical protein